jgi:hypothetical protein
MTGIIKGLIQEMLIIHFQYVMWAFYFSSMVYLIIADLDVFSNLIEDGRLRQSWTDGLFGV